MRTSQSKYDNTSTSSSQYFKQRYFDYGGSKISNSHIDNNKSRRNSGNSQIFSPSLISKVVADSEYEIYRPSCYSNIIANQQQFVLKRLQQQTKRKQHKNPFLATVNSDNQSTINRTKSYHTIQQQSLYQQKQQQQQQRQSSQSHYLTNIKQHKSPQQDRSPSLYSNKNINKKLFQTKSNIDNYDDDLTEILHTQNQYQNGYYYEGNVGVKNKGNKKRDYLGMGEDNYNNIKNSYNEKNNNYKLSQPITLVKSSKSHDNKLRSQDNKLTVNNDNVQFITQNYQQQQHKKQSPSQQPSTFQQQPHKQLQHIHFSIKNQSNILDIYKQFSQQQKQKINQQFVKIKRQMQNKLNEVKNKIYEQIDQNYYQLMIEMGRLREMAGVMWERKSNTTNIRNKSRSIDKHLITTRPSSSINKNNISTKFPQQYQHPHLQQINNNNLLQQLHKQDNKLQQYLQTKRRYFNSNQYQQNNDLIDRNRLLRDMYECSLNIAMRVKQCQDIFYDKIKLDNVVDKERFLCWVNNVNINNSFKNKNVYNNSYGYCQSVSLLRSEQLQLLTKMVNNFRSLVDERFLQLPKQ